MDTLSVSISLSRKINLGNYESADAFVSVSGITADTTEEQIQELLDGNGALGFQKVKAALLQQVAGVKS